VTLTVWLEHTLYLTHGEHTLYLTQQHQGECAPTHSLLYNRDSYNFDDLKRHFDQPKRHFDQPKRHFYQPKRNFDHTKAPLWPYQSVTLTVPKRALPPHLKTTQARLQTARRKRHQSAFQSVWLSGQWLLLHLDNICERTNRIGDLTRHRVSWESPLMVPLRAHMLSIDYRNYQIQKIKVIN